MSENPQPGNQNPPAEESRPRMHPVVKATGFVSFFTDMGSEISYPIMPLFLSALGASKATIGAIEGMAEGLPALIKLFAGAMSDRVKNRKWMVLAGYALSTLFKPLTAFAQTALFVFVMRFVDRIGKGIRTAPRDALVADFTDKSTRGAAFGYQRGMDHAGALLGGLIGGGLLYVLGSDLAAMRKAILLSFIPGLLSIATIVIFIRDRGDRAPGPSRFLNPFRGLGAMPRSYFAFIAIASVFTMANSSDAFLLLRARDMGVTTRYVPFIWSLLHLVKSATSIWGGGLSDRIGRKPVLFCGWFVYALTYAGFALLSGIGWAWGLFCLYGLFYGLTEGASRAVIADMVPEGMRGQAFGFWGMLEGTLLVMASLLTGLLWDKTGGAKIPFLMCGAFSLAAVLVLGLWSGLSRTARSSG